jgi:hypothetical protein
MNIEAIHEFFGNIPKAERDSWLPCRASIRAEDGEQVDTWPAACVGAILSTGYPLDSIQEESDIREACNQFQMLWSNGLVDGNEWQQNTWLVVRAILELGERCGWDAPQYQFSN